MHLTEDQVKQAILHDDRDVREAAIYFFSKSFSTDHGIMPLAIQAIEQHGWEDAFEAYSFIQDLVQTDESVHWLIDQFNYLGHLEESDGDGRYVHGIAQGLIHAQVKVLERHAAQILDLDGLDEKAKDTICQRVRFSTQPPEHLWLQLTEFCTRSDKLNGVPDDLELACDLAEALGRHPDFTVHKILPILNGETGDSDNWIELFAVRLAGELRLHNAVAQIVKRLTTADDWMFEESERALIKINGDEVVEEIGRAYPTSEFGFKITASAILESIHTKSSAETALGLFKSEKDEDERGRLLQSALMNFSTDAIEPARQFILTASLSPEVLEVRSDLLVACKIMREKFPEFDVWAEESKNDGEFRRKWYRKNPLISNLLDYEEELADDEDDEPLPPRDTIVREVRVGRNDPCPCGSGRKFKKCCLGKGSGV